MLQIQVSVLICKPQFLGAWAFCSVTPLWVLGSRILWLPWAGSRAGRYEGKGAVCGLQDPDLPKGTLEMFLDEAWS